MASRESGDPVTPAQPAGIRVLYVGGRTPVTEGAPDRLERALDRLTVAREPRAMRALDRLCTVVDPSEDRAAARGFDCIVSEDRLAEMDSLDFLGVIRDHYPDLPFVLFAEDGNEEVVVEALRAGVTDYVRATEADDPYALLADRVATAVDQFRADSATVERYRSLVEHSGDVIVSLDEDGVFQFVSPGITHTAGYEPEELIGSNAFEYVHPDDREAVRRQFDAGLANVHENIGRIEYRFRDADGEWRWYESIGSSAFESAVGGYVITSRDITDRKEYERELEQYKTMMQTVPDGVILLDDEGKMTRVNDAWAEFVGYDGAEQLTGKPFQELVGEGVIDESIIDRYLENVKTLLSTDADSEQATFKTKVVPPNSDHEHVYEAHIALLPFETEFDGAIAVVRDITEKVRRRHELERQNERLEKFASAVSHDLRNPLDIAMSRAELIRDEHGIDRAANLVETLDDMATLIDDVLALARQGQVVDDPDPVDLETVVHDAAETVGIDSGDGETDARTTLSVAEDLPTVPGDEERLGALFENLLSNAVTHAGPDVEVRIGRIDEVDSSADDAGPGSRSWTGFYVADDGPGIAEDDADRIFDAGFTTAEVGNGFGLNIVQEIVQAHDWSIQVTEARDGGARFEVTEIPVIDVDAEPATDSDPGEE